MKLIEKDTFGDDINIAHLTDRLIIKICKNRKIV